MSQYTTWEFVQETKKPATRDDILLSICIPSYNRAPLVEKLVKQCLAIFPDDDVEIIVSNNASEDDTDSRLSAIKDPRFVYYNNEVSLGELTNSFGIVNNILYVLALANGKWCMELTDKDEFVGLDWPKMRQILQNSDDVAMFKGAYYTGEGTPLVLTPVKVYKGGYAETYSFLMSTCSYATNTIVRRDIYLQSLAELSDKFNVMIREPAVNVWQTYPHVCVFSHCLKYGTLAPMPNWTLRRQFHTESPEARKYYASYGFNRNWPNEDPYWTPFSRLEQHTEWMKLFCSLIKSPEEKIQMACGLMFGLLNIVVDYYDKIHSPNIPGIHFHRPDVLERDHHRPSADWRNFFWHAYLRFAREMSAIFPELSAVNESMLVQVANIYQNLIEKIKANEKITKSSH